MQTTFNILGLVVLVAVGVNEYRKKGFGLWSGIAFVGAACYAGVLAIQTFNP